MTLTVRHNNHITNKYIKKERRNTYNRHTPTKKHTVFIPINATAFVLFKPVVGGGVY